MTREARCEHLIGMKVIYRSASGKEYKAIITRISDTNPSTVSLIFENNRKKYIKKDRVLHIEESTTKTKVWIYDQGKYAWKDGKFIDEEEE